MKRTFFFIVLFVIAAELCLSGVPHTITYQGVLTDSNGLPVADGMYAITFRLYDVAAGGSPLWDETQSLQVTGGRFDAILGRTVPLGSLAFDVTYWFALSVEGASELSPRLELSSAPYSLTARTVEDSVVTGEKLAAGTVVRSVNNVSDEVALVAGENVTVTTSNDTIRISSQGEGDGDWIVSGEKMYNGVASEVGIGTTNPTAPLHVTTDGAETVARYEKPFFRTFSSYISGLAINSSTTRSAWRITSDLGAGLSTYIDSYGFLHLGDVYGAFPNLQRASHSSSLNETVGPALRILGDILAGDLTYFGATGAAGTEVQQIGVRIQGAFPSATHLMTGERDLLRDGTSGAHIILRPDDGNQGALQGSIDISAYGSSVAGNFIRFLVRNGADSAGEVARIDGSGLTVNGKASFSGGVDPPYVSFTAETHASIRAYAKEVQSKEKIMMFWNSEAHRMEIYDIEADRFYTLTGETVAE